MVARISYGSLLIGGLMAFGFSGIVAVQAVIYFKLYPNDRLLKKLVVSFVWFLDLLHSSFIAISLVNYFIVHFNDAARIDHIPWSIALTVVVTAGQTLIAHCFFALKIHKASGKNWLITVPILILASGRLLAASVSTTEMIRLQRFSAFTRHYPGWVFTTGLSLSAGVDIIITACLCYFLRKIRQRLGSSESIMIHVVDVLTLYTLENGLLTCLTTTASLICWLAMPYNLVFFGLHFVIGKLYANSLLASLNTRKEFSRMQVDPVQPWSRYDTTNPILSSEDFYSTRRYHDPMSALARQTGLAAHTYRVPRTHLRRESGVFDSMQRNSLDSFDYPRNERAAPIRRTPTVLQYSPRLP